MKVSPSGPAPVMTEESDPAGGRIVLALAGALLVILGLCLGWWLVAAGAARTGELALDVQFAATRRPFEIAIARVGDPLFGGPVAPLVLVAVCALLWVRSRAAAIRTALLTAAGAAAATVGKYLVSRDRPPTDAVHALVMESGPNSFPSGHTAFAAALVLAVVLTWPGGRAARVWVAVAGGLVTLVVGVSRLVLGAHYLGDVAGSLFIGAGAVLFAEAVLPTGFPTSLHRRQAPLG